MNHETIVQVVREGVTTIQVPGQPTATTVISTGLVPEKGDKGEPGIKGDKGDPGAPGTTASALGGLPVSFMSPQDGDVLGISAGTVVNIADLSLNAGYF